MVKYDCDQIEWTRGSGETLSNFPIQPFPVSVSVTCTTRKTPSASFMQLSSLDLSIFFYNDNAVELRYIDLHATPLRLRSLPSIGRPD